MGGRSSSSNGNLSRRSAESSRFSPASFQFRSSNDAGVSALMNGLDRRFGVSRYSNGNVGFGTATLSDGDMIGFGYDDRGAYIVRQGRKFYDLDEFERVRSGRRR